MYTDFIQYILQILSITKYNNFNNQYVITTIIKRFFEFHKKKNIQYNIINRQCSYTIQKFELNIIFNEF